MVISTIASGLSNLGVNIQKYGFMQESKKVRARRRLVYVPRLTTGWAACAQPIATRRPYVRLPAWW